MDVCCRQWRRWRWSNPFALTGPNGLHCPAHVLTWSRAEHTHVTRKTRIPATLARGTNGSVLRRAAASHRCIGATQQIEIFTAELMKPPQVKDPTLRRLRSSLIGTGTAGGGAGGASGAVVLAALVVLVAIYSGKRTWAGGAGSAHHS